MARIEVVMPQMGESIAEGTIVKWHKKPGDRVRKDETLLEISTDKVDSEIPSPASGVLAEITVKENETVAVRTVIGFIETEAAEEPDTKGESRTPTPQPEPKAASPKPEQQEVQGAPPARTEAPARTASPPHTAAQQPPSRGQGRFYSPLVLSVAQAEGITMAELERVPGTGEGGRVTKKDLQSYVDARKRRAGEPAQRPAPEVAPAGPAPTAAAAPGTPRSSAPILATPVDAPDLSSKYPSPGHEILQMSNVLRRMAQHMVTSVQTSPHVAAIHEVDMTEVVRHRGAHAEEFERREGFKLTYTPYIVDAVVKAITKYPLINCSVEGDKIIKKNYINLGIAVASDNGLIVPVIKHAEEKSFLGYARAVHDLARRARGKKLTPEEIQGGTFTITNYGVFGTMIGTPIINQPQVAILGTGVIRKRVIVMEDDALAVRSMAYFTLSFDHRVVDGALGGMFLDDVVKSLETFAGTADL